MRNLLVLSFALNLFFVSGLGLAYGFGGMNSQAQEDTSGPNFEKSAAANKEGVTGVQMIQLAADLARYGRDNKNPGALAMASNIMATVAVKEPKALADKFKDNKGEGGEAMTAENLLKEAKEMGGEHGAPFMDAIAKMGMKGRGLATGVSQVSGLKIDAAGQKNGKLAPSTIAQKLKFKKGEYAAIWVGGDGSTDIDLYIFDKDGKALVASDQRPGDSCWVEFVPEEEEYTVIIVNWGNKANTFSIVFN